MPGTHDVTYLAKRDEGWSPVLGGVPGSVFDDAAGLQVTAHGDLVFAGARDGGHSVALAGIPGPSFYRVEQLTLSPDRRHIAYAGDDGPDASVVVRDNEPGPRGLIDTHDRVQLVFSPNNEHLAWSQVGVAGSSVVDDDISPR